MTVNCKLAILVDPNEVYPPSDKQALDYIEYLSRKMKITVDYLTKRDLSLLKFYSALFIRTVTDKDNYTYQWSELSKYLGLKLIDTPQAIALGCDKHLQYELCKIKRIHIPETQIIYVFDDINLIQKKLEINFPMVLKIPNGSFSKGTYKIHDLQELKQKVKKLFATKKFYSLILQEYLYTEYDWRVGILNHKPLFVCKYYMAPNHWQVIKYNHKHFVEGDSETLPINHLPTVILKCVNDVMSLLDDGFYGIDIKLYNNKAYLIEINDNPNVCFDIEDLVEREILYKKILSNFYG